MAEPAAWNAFLASLHHPQPPAGLAPALLGAWHALRDEWHRAHAAVQPDDAACAWLHAALHRAEGDLTNADYWYGRAGRERPTGPARAEYLAIARALLTDRSAAAP